MLRAWTAPAPEKTLRDLRRSRRRHYLREGDWVDSLYKAYIVVIIAAARALLRHPGAGWRHRPHRDRRRPRPRRGDPRARTRGPHGAGTAIGRARRTARSRGRRRHLPPARAGRPRCRPPGGRVPPDPRRRARARGDRGSRRQHRRQPARRRARRVAARGRRVRRVGVVRGLGRRARRMRRAASGCATPTSSAAC